MQIAWDAIRWWELRRIIFNMVLLVVGSASLWLFYLAAPCMVMDMISLPAIGGIILYGVAANLCYTLGWLTEWAWSQGDTSLTRNARPRLFKLGLVFSVFLTA